MLITKQRKKFHRLTKILVFLIMLKTTFLLIGLSVFLFIISPTQTTAQYDYEAQNKWVDSVYQSLTPAKRLGQLFMVAAYSNRDDKHYQEIKKLIKIYNIGGLIFFQGGPQRQAKLTNQYQAATQTPLLIAMDAEWGLAMRLDSTYKFPKQMTLGATANNEVIYDMGAEIAKHSRRLGVHINFAPVVDINSNPANPVIGYRSFGEDKHKVSAKGIAYMKGMQDHGVIANAKHFPGHGDTGSDSHYTLPVIKHDKQRLDSIELYPFKQLIKDSLKSAMVAHIHIPAYDDTPNKATTLSRYVVTDLLKNKLQFKGLVFTDALNMKGVSKFYKPGEVDLLALKAGNDVLLFSENVPKAIEKIQQALAEGALDSLQVENSIKKMLAAKYFVGLNDFIPIKTDSLFQDLNSPQSELIKQNIYKQAATIVKDNKNLLPIKILEERAIATLSIGSDSITIFQKYLGYYNNMEHTMLPRKPDPNKYDLALNKLKNFDLVIVGVHGLHYNRRKMYGINKEDLHFLETLKKHTNVIVTVFGLPYTLKYFENNEQLICMYQDEPASEKAAAQLIFGAIPASGTLPVTVTSQLTEGLGIKKKAIERLQYTEPEAVKINGERLRSAIDSIANEAIRIQATPGCQVLVARHGKVILNKSYGYFTYDSTVKVTNESIYDIASVTKVAATLQAIMFLEGRGVIDLNKKMAHYLPELKKTNKRKMTVQDVLLHQAGLKPFIPIWQRTVDAEGERLTAYYNLFLDQQFSNQVAPGLYALGSLRDSIWHWTVNSKLRKKPRRSKTYDYKYSDIGFYMLQKLAETLLNQPIEDFLEQNFYRPLGLSTMSYLPLCKFPATRVVPTEEEKSFRKTLICGIVHDPGAALYGGVAGHAGIFSNANDLAILLQMNLQDGYYGGLQYIPSGTVSKFSKKQVEKNRRGLGWDKPLEEGNGPTSDLASLETYGHTGFTGTAAWVDPKYELIYIFLSNRVYPDANNKKLLSKDIRTRIQGAIYDAMLDYKPER